MSGGLGRSRRFDVLLLVTPTVGALALDAVSIINGTPAWHLAVVIISALSLVLRRRWPVPVLLLATGSFILTLDLLPLAIAGYAVTAAARLPLWARLLPVALLVVIPLTYVGRSLLAPPDSVVPQSLVLNVSVVIVICAVLPTALGLLVRARREQAAVITQLTRSRRREAQLIAAVARVQERTLLAREMHDVVADKISLISVRAGALVAISASGELRPEQVRTEANTIRGLSRTTLTELRDVITVLRDPAERTSEGLAAIPALVSDSDLDAELITPEESPEARWDPMVQRTAYRTVQEALTNIRKYAPSAPVVVELAEVEERLEITVRNGPPTSPAPAEDLPSGGHGLIGLRERAELLAADFHAAPTADGGFEVRVRIPAQTRQLPAD